MNNYTITHSVTLPSTSHCSTVADKRQRYLHFVNANALNQHLVANVEPVLLSDYFSAMQNSSRVTDRS